MELPQNWVSLDPGHTGGMARWKKGELMSLHRFKKTKGQRWIGEDERKAVAQMAGGCTLLVAELVLEHRMAKQSPVHAVTSAVNLGMQVGICMQIGCDIKFIRPRDWTRAFGLTSDKAGHLALAREMFPDFVEDLKFLACDGPADAALIGQHYINTVRNT